MPVLRVAQAFLPVLFLNDSFTASRGYRRLPALHLPALTGPQPPFADISSNLADCAGTLEAWIWIDLKSGWPGGATVGTDAQACPACCLAGWWLWWDC